MPGLKKTTAPLVASAALHAVAICAMAFTRPTPRESPVDSVVMDVDLWAPPLESPEQVEAEPSGGKAAAKAGPTMPTRSLPIRARSTVTESPDESTLAPSPRPADSSGPWSPSRPAPYDLGIGTYWMSVATQPGPPAASSSERPPHPPSPPSFEQTMREAADARDRAVGLGREGPLLSAAHEAASPSFAPDVGSATLEVESDASGKVLAAHVVSASGDVPAWNDVARELVRLMASKPMRAPRGGGGRHARLRIVAERTLPSGAAYARSPGPAIREEECVGQPDPRLGGLGRRCSTGMPAGAQQTFDVSDVGARPSRVVHVQFLGETE
jgi:hypothetical protein